MVTNILKNGQVVKDMRTVKVPKDNGAYELLRTWKNERKKY